MEKLTWFKFIISDWMMGKIMKCPEVTQARFIRLCCLYWNKECLLSLEDAEIEIDEDHIKILLSKKIIEKSGDFIIIKFLDEQDKGINSISVERSKAAKIRWEKNRILKEIAMQDDANAYKSNANAMQIDAEKRREEKKRKDDDEYTTPSIVFYPIYEFEKTVFDGTEFGLLCIRNGKKTLDQVKSLFPVFIQEKKALNQLAWKSEVDAKTHFINWLKKQPSTQKTVAQILTPYGQAAN